MCWASSRRADAESQFNEAVEKAINNGFDFKEPVKRIELCRYDVDDTRTEWEKVAGFDCPEDPGDSHYTLSNRQLLHSWTPVTQPV